MKPIQISSRIRRETEKAVLAEVVTGRGNHAEVWFPKSQIRLEGSILWAPEWLINAKSRDVGGIITLDPSVMS